MPCILVVEDDPDTRDALREALENEGFEVRTARDSAAAVGELREEAASVVLVDSWPHGVDVSWLPGDVPVVVMSAVPQSPQPRVVHVLEKPFSLEQLLAAVRKYCS